MRTRGIGLIVLLLTATLAQGCYTALRDRAAKEGPEREVKDTLTAFESAYNRKDRSALARCLDNFPILEVEASGLLPVGELVGREEVEGGLMDAMRRFPRMTLGEQTLFLTLDSGNKAVTEVISNFEDSVYVIKFSMMKDVNGWVIKKMVIY